MSEILNVDFSNTLWWVSQAFSFVALVFMVWSFQIKNKILLMLFLGFGTMFLAISASFLENYTLAVLFGQAAIRNYVFSYLDWRESRNKYVAQWLRYLFAAIFATGTIVSTILLVHVWPVATVGAWLEWLICITLIGLIVGNILKGTNVMRLSFVANRVFNIINHLYFANYIAVIIAALAIISNIIFYTRMLISWIIKRREKQVVQ
jgi:hypothetical protein